MKKRIKHTGMILNDLQNAFDTLDHTILFRENEAHWFFR